nr:MAG TPA: hypothetical protein [Caudoviricetes sp.]
MRARRRLAETGRCPELDPSLEANFTHFEPTYSLTSFFSSCYKNSYFFLLILRLPARRYPLRRYLVGARV